jgi:hypothetical protein
MPRAQRFAQYVQELAYARIFEAEERDERPADVPPRADDVSREYAVWNATSFSSYVPFRGPTNG